MKWSSLANMRAIHSFVQASADIAVAASSPINLGQRDAEKNPSSPFLIPSFVRVSYVSGENSKVAKWRMHGDFFHPAAWEICKDSYDMTWIADSLSGAGGINGLCQSTEDSNGDDCGQWWVYMAEEQMPTSPEVYANEVTPSLIRGGSNYIWMLTERQRQEIVKLKMCEHEKKNSGEKCGQEPQAVIPLGNLESFLINYTPNSALG